MKSDQGRVSEERHKMAVVTTEDLGGTVGAEVLGVDSERLRDDSQLPAAILEALETAGVLVFRGLKLDPESQVAFCKKIGPVETKFAKAHPVEGVMRVNLDRSKTDVADYLRGNFGWHIDGCTPHDDAYPPMVTMLTAQVVAEGGDTEFASTYAAYDDLSADEKTAFGSLRVLHKFESAVLPFLDNPTPEHLARLRAQPTQVHPLVWTHISGRRSLVIGTHADQIVDLPPEEGRTLLVALLERATRPEGVYRHTWEPGDTVMWDNRGLLHRVSPYDITRPRDMLRTTVLGQEPIQ
jgi:alpha-ketoglutarate-dependent taurine dioxygenase